MSLTGIGAIPRKERSGNEVTTDIFSLHKFGGTVSFLSSSRNDHIQFSMVHCMVDTARYRYLQTPRAMVVALWDSLMAITTKTEAVY